MNLVYRYLVPTGFGFLSIRNKILSHISGDVSDFNGTRNWMGLLEVEIPVVSIL
jgi:hypothetical protein